MFFSSFFELDLLITLIIALPMTAISAYGKICFKCSFLEIPNPTAIGIEKIFLTLLR